MTLAKQPFVQTLIGIKSKCETMATIKTHPSYINLFGLVEPGVYQLEEFCRIQQEQCLNTQKKLQLFRKEVAVRISEVLQV